MSPGPAAQICMPKIAFLGSLCLPELSSHNVLCKLNLLRSLRAAEMSRPKPMRWRKSLTQAVSVLASLRQGRCPSSFNEGHALIRSPHGKHHSLYAKFNILIPTSRATPQLGARPTVGPSRWKPRYSRYREIKRRFVNIVGACT